MSLYRNMGTLERGHMQRTVVPDKPKEPGMVKEGEIPHKPEDKITTSVVQDGTAATASTGKAPLAPEEVNDDKTDKGSFQQSAFHLSTIQTLSLVLIGIACCAVLVAPDNNFVNVIFKTWTCERHFDEVPEELKLQTKFFEEMRAIVSMLKNTESNLVFVNRSLTVFMKEGEHEKPAIILLLATKSSSCSLCEILRRFTEALCSYYGQEYPEPEQGYIKADDVRSRNGNDGKLYIENNIENVADNGKHVVIFEDIDKFPASSLSKIHSYLDRENPPHRDMVYILTGVIADDQGEFEVEKYKELNRIATKHFDQQWLNYDEDHRRALMGRMTAVIGFIRQTKILVDSINEKQQNTCKQKCEL